MTKLGRITVFIGFVILFVIAFIACEKGDEPVVACFDYYLIGTDIILAEDSVQFTNCSQNATSYKWDFGDGTISTETNPTHNFGQDFPYVVKLTAINSSYSDVFIDSIWGWNTARKPNIYIYPEETTSLCVNVNFPKSGQIIASEPEYENGWCVSVEPSGKINGTYDFLFYESIQPNIWQTNYGWCVAKNELESFFQAKLTGYNLSENEISDFIEYWIPTLSDYNYYKIYPQLNGTINRVISLDFSKRPDNIFRLFFAFEGVSEKESLVQPDIVPAIRSGFNVVEWGGVIL